MHLFSRRNGEPRLPNARLNSCLRGVAGLWTGELWPRVLVTNEAITLNGSVPRVQGLYGPAAQFSVGYNYLRLAADADTLFKSTTTCTVALLYRHRDTTLRNAGLFGYGFGTNTVNVVIVGGNIYWDFGNDTATAGGGRIGTSWTKTTNWETLICVAGAGRGREIWRNGVKIAGDTAQNASRGTTSYMAHIGCAWDRSYEADNVDISQVVVVNGSVWTPAECAERGRSPAALIAATFAPMPRRIWVPAGGSTVTAATSLAAAVQLASTLTASLSAGVQTTPTTAVVTDAAVQTAVAAQAQLEAAVQSAATAIASLQAAVQAGGESTCSLRAAVELARSATAALELAVQTQGNVTASVSAQIQSTGTATTSLEAFVQAGSSVTTSLAAAVLRDALTTAALDVTLQTPRDATSGMSAALQVATAAAAAVDLALQSARSESASLSAQVQGGFVASADISTAVQAGAEAATAVHAAIAVAASTSLALDAAVMVQRTLAAAMEAAVQSALSRQAGLSAYVEDQSGVVFFAPAVARTVVVEPESRVLAIGPESRVLVIT